MVNISLRSKIIISLIAMLTGFLITISIHSVNFSFIPKTNEQYKKIISYIETLEKENAALQEGILATREEINSIQGSDTTDEGIIKILQDKINRLNSLAGFSEVTGNGVIFTISDNTDGAEKMQKSNPAMYFPEEFIVHAKDLRYLLNAVSKDALAISINGHRIVDSSNITCVGTVVMVNASRLAPPYEITIVGDPSLIENDLLNSDRYLYLDYKEMPMKIEIAESLTVPAFSDTYTIDHTSIDD